VHSVFGKINYGVLKKQQLILGTGTDIWWVTEPHCGDVSLGWHQERQIGQAQKLG
jgi:hypothetical protein